MPVFCSAYGCPSNAKEPECKDHISFHGFPLADNKLLNEWIAKTKRQDFKPTIHSKLCSEHFDLGCFETLSDTGERILKPEAIPTKFSFNQVGGSRNKYKSSEPMYWLSETNDIDINREPSNWPQMPNLTLSNMKRNKQHSDTSKKPKTKKSHICEVCGKGFRKRGELQRHLGTHTDNKHNVCDVCNKVFRLKGNLKKHLLTHTDGTDTIQMTLPVCDVCNKEFSDKHNLRKHKLIHKGEKAFACYLCDKKFIQKSNLEQHLMRHSGVKLYVCFVCNKKLAQKASLERHLLIHTGEKPFACNVCNKKFRQSWHARRHLLSHSLKQLATGRTSEEDLV